MTFENRPHRAANIVYYKQLCHHCCNIVATLLHHCCNIVALLHCCIIVATLSITNSCVIIVATSMNCCIVALLHHCCNIVYYNRFSHHCCIKPMIISFSQYQFHLRGLVDTSHTDCISGLVTHDHPPDPEQLVQAPVL